MVMSLPETFAATSCPAFTTTAALPTRGMRPGCFTAPAQGPRGGHLSQMASGRYEHISHLVYLRLYIYIKKEEAVLFLEQARANYGPGAVWGLLRFLIGPAKLEEMILIVSKS